MTHLFSRLLAAGAAAILLTSCTTINPYTREGQVSQATKGAAIGAAAGAAVGALTGGDSRERRHRNHQASSSPRY